MCTLLWGVSIVYNILNARNDPNHTGILINFSRTFNLQKEVCLKSPLFARASALPVRRHIFQCTEKYFVPLVITDDVRRLILLKLH
jgi:hypothetical protein